MLVKFKTNEKFGETIAGATAALKKIKGGKIPLARWALTQVNSLVDEKGTLKISTARAMDNCLLLRNSIPWKYHDGGEYNNRDIEEIINLLEEIANTGRPKTMFKSQEDLFNFINGFFWGEEEQPWDLVGCGADSKISIRWKDSKKWNSIELLVSPNLEVKELKEIKSVKAKEFEEKLKSFYKDRDLIKA